MKTNKLIAAALLPLLFSCAKENIEPSTDPVSDGKYVTVNLVPDEDSITKATYDDDTGITWTKGEYYAGIINASGDKFKSQALDSLYERNGNMQASFKFLHSELSEKTGPYILYYPYHYYAEYTDGKYKIPQYVGAVQNSGIGLSSESLAVVSKKAIDLTQYEQTEYDNNGAEVSFKVVGSYIRLLVYGGNKEDEKIDYIRIHDLKGENWVAGTYYVSVSVDGENNSTIQLGDGYGDLYNEIILNFDEKPATKIDRADAKGIYAQVRQGKHQLAYEIHTKVGDVKYTYIFKYPKETDFAFSSIKDIPLNIAKATATVENIPEELYIVGDVSFVGWNHNNAIKMDKNGYIFTKDVYLNTKVKKDGSYSDAEGFKFLLQNTSFDPAYVNGGDNTLAYYNGGDSNKDIKFKVDKSGYYTVTADFSTGKVTCTPAAPEKLYVWGAATTAGWDSTKAIQLDQDQNDKFVFTKKGISLKKEGEYKFFSDNHEYTSYVNDGNGNLVFFDSPSGTDKDKKFTVDKSGIYNLTVNFDDCSLKADFVSDYPKVWSNNKSNTYSMTPTAVENEYKATAYLGVGNNAHDFFIYQGNEAYHEVDYKQITFSSDSEGYSGTVTKDTKTGLGWWISDDNMQTNRLYDITLNTATNTVTVKFAQGTNFWLIGYPFGGYTAFNKPDKYMATADENGVAKWIVTTTAKGDFKICGEHTLEDAFWKGEWYYSNATNGIFDWSWGTGNNYSQEFDVKAFIPNGADYKWSLNETGTFEIVFDTKNLKIKISKTE